MLNITYNNDIIFIFLENLTYLIIMNKCLMSPLPSLLVPKIFLLHCIVQHIITPVQCAWPIYA
jgi:hypothetical protein